jgi:hypothetical protein
LGATVCLYLGTVRFTSRNFPPVNTDEVVRAVFGRERVEGRPARYTLYDDIFAPAVYPLRDVLPEVALSIYHTWVGVWTGPAPRGPGRARLSSLVAGLLTLLIFFGIGRRWSRARAFWGMGLLIAGPLFLLTSSLARPETLLLAVTGANLWFVLACPDRITLKPFCIGFLALASMGIHPNASVIAAGVFTLHMLRLSKGARFGGMILFILGGFSGLTAVFITLDPRHLWMGFHTLHSALLKPPLFSFPPRPLDWLGATVDVLWNGKTFYFDPGRGFGWTLSNRIWWTLTGGTALLSLFGPGEEARECRRWAMALGTAFLCSLALVKAKDCVYGTNFFPFLIPLAAAGLSRLNGRRRFLLRLTVGSAAVVCGVIYGTFSRTYAGRCRPFETIAAEIRAALPPGPVKIAGPNVLWFGGDTENFRDIGAVVISRWYCGGVFDLRTWLGNWKPDVLILDEFLGRLLPGDRPVREKLADQLGRPVDFLKEVDTGLAYGKWGIYRVTWETPRRTPPGPTTRRETR